MDIQFRLSEFIFPKKQIFEKIKMNVTLLRKTRFDELPQLWNIMRGDMSLVGPHPPLRSEVKLYNPSERRRLYMKPGITCI